MSALVTDAFRLNVREAQGGSTSNTLRKTGFIPGIVYGAQKENTKISCDIRDVEKGLNQTNFYTTIYEINLGGKAERVMVKEVQYHPVTDRPIHIDFLRVAKGAKLHLKVPVVFLNQEKCVGIKRGGLLNIVLHTLDVTCSVDNVPDHIEIDLLSFDIGHSIHTADVNLGAGVAATHPERDSIVATIVAPTIQKETEEVAAAAEPEAADAAAAKK